MRHLTRKYETQTDEKKNFNRQHMKQNKIFTITNKQTKYEMDNNK